LPGAKPEVEVAQDFAASAVAQANAVKFDDRGQRGAPYPLVVLSHSARRLAKHRGYRLPSLPSRTL
jgi:pyruvate/2-oxoglutarate dehydrogenase complex dihydrolipoamide acyltransferase (E2) component